MSTHGKAVIEPSSSVATVTVTATTGTGTGTGTRDKLRAKLVDRAERVAWAAAWTDAWNAGDVDALVERLARDAAVVADAANAHEVVVGREAVREAWDRRARGMRDAGTMRLDVALVDEAGRAITVVYDVVPLLPTAAHDRVRAVELIHFDEEWELVVRAEAFQGMVFFPE